MLIAFCLLLFLSLVISAKTFLIQSASKSTARSTSKRIGQVVSVNNLELCAQRSDSTPEIQITSQDAAISIGVGVAGLLIILANRIIFSDYSSESLVSDTQSRADILALLSCSALLLDAFSGSDIKTRSRDKVQLLGYSYKSPKIFTDKVVVATKLKWLLDNIIKNSPVQSAVFIDNSFQLIAFAGVVGNKYDQQTSIEKENIPILRKNLMEMTELYLPDVQILPGKVEFTYLPINIQSVLIIPFTCESTQGVLVLGNNQAKSLTLDILQRIRKLVQLVSG